ncbi:MULTISPECIES: hypothetical protein [unclassified Zunongwangia]|uniref:hypothetical protein n=1 Tax=unclassified Zunongwangia TaxID=2632541 RepID=UPI0022DDE133|nr:MULTISPECIES: hypothetical protein [unclassified Zunongwangia]WBL21342.1 hypothetical protein PBT89_11405 [Zunongwangia sp. HRR-M8]WBL26807.1 hypothetical protein PBT91_05965 [Zunongwangia sp. HGR-M22]
MKKIFRTISFFLFIGCHLAFLTSVLFEKVNNLWLILGVLCASILITYAYYHKSIQEEEHFLDDLQDIVYISFGGLLTYFISTNLEFGAVIAAGFTGTLASYLPSFSKNSKWLKRTPVPLYCGAFVGMTAPSVSSGYTFIIFTCFLTGVLFISAKNVFNGFGGKLGTIAFGGVALSSLIIYLLF